MRACSVKKGKEGTGRAVTWRQIRAVNAFTMEVSFSGASIGSRAGCVRARARTGICTFGVCDARACSYHFSLDDLKGVGPSFCRAIAAAWCPAETSTHLPLHPAIRQAPVITRHTSHITHHTSSHVTRHTSHITHTSSHTCHQARSCRPRQPFSRCLQEGRPPLCLPPRPLLLPPLSTPQDLQRPRCTSGGRGGGCTCRFTAVQQQEQRQAAG